MDSGINEELTLGVAVLLDIPDSILLADNAISHYLVLVEAPVWQLSSTELKRLARVDVNQAYLTTTTI